MNTTSWLVVLSLIGIGLQAHINRRHLVGVVESAVDAARAELEADKLAVIAEIQRLGLPDEDVSAVLAKIQSLGQVFDDVPGVTPVPPPPLIEPVS